MQTLFLLSLLPLESCRQRHQHDGRNFTPCSSANDDSFSCVFAAESLPISCSASSGSSLSLHYKIVERDVNTAALDREADARSHPTQTSVCCFASSTSEDAYNVCGVSSAYLGRARGNGRTPELSGNQLTLQELQQNGAA